MSNCSMTCYSIKARQGMECRRMRVWNDSGRNAPTSPNDVGGSRSGRSDRVRTRAAHGSPEFSQRGRASGHGGGGRRGDSLSLEHAGRVHPGSSRRQDGRNRGKGRSHRAPRAAAERRDAGSSAGRRGHADKPALHSEQWYRSQVYGRQDLAFADRRSRAPAVESEHRGSEETFRGRDAEGDHRMRRQR